MMESDGLLSEFRGSNFGAWCAINSSFSAELVAMLDFDFVVIDMQHGLVDYASLTSMLQAIENRKKMTFVRIPLEDFGLLQRALDAGAGGVIVPMVNSSRDAKLAVNSAKYPPIGQRSYGPIRSQFVSGADTTKANALIKCFVQIETREAVNNLSEILSVQGIDGTYIGPADLAISYGIEIGERNEQLEELISEIRIATQNANLQAAIHTTNGLSARQRLAENFNFVSLGSDAIWLKNGYAREVAEALDKPYKQAFRFY